MAAPLRYFFSRNVLEISRNTLQKNGLGASWSVLSRTIHKNSGLMSNSAVSKQHDSDHSIVKDEGVARHVVERVNAQVAARSHGRLFAVVSVGGKQKKITQDDLIIVEDIFPPTVGERIRLEKVLIVGGHDFSVIGRPILGRDQVTVEAVVVEKTLDVPKPVSYYRPRRNFFRFKRELM